MSSTSTLIAELDALLTPERFEDYGPNGLQVPGTRDVQTVATGVTASVHLFAQAAAEGAELVLVHHGLFWRGMPQHVDRALYRRLELLFRHDMALAAYHLPLDAHMEYGNNALLARGLGLLEIERFADLGAAGRFGGDGIPAEELVARVREVTDRGPLHFAFGPERIRSLAIVSGGGSDYVLQAAAEGYDAFLTGEPAERVMAQAREERIHFLAAGHYATETFGVRAVGELLAERLGIRHVFLDDPNPI
jgi:dinuclear metal center YbgI/SA1388 family protein